MLSHQGADCSLSPINTHDHSLDRKTSVKHICPATRCCWDGATPPLQSSSKKEMSAKIREALNDGLADTMGSCCQIDNCKADTHNRSCKRPNTCCIASCVWIYVHTWCYSSLMFAEYNRGYNEVGRYASQKTGCPGDQSSHIQVCGDCNAQTME